MRTLLVAAGAGMLLMLGGCGTAAASHPARHTAPPAAGLSPATIPATPPPPLLTFTCRVGWIDTGNVTVPYAAQQPPGPGVFLPDTRADWAAGQAGQADQTGFLVTVTNHSAGVIPVGGVTVQVLAYGQPGAGSVTTTPAESLGVGPGETWTVADTFTDAAGGTGLVQVSERTYLHSTCTASIPVTGTLG